MYINQPEQYNRWSDPNVTKPRLPQVAQIEEHATNAGFNVTRLQALRPPYAKTLDIWAANLQSNTDEAIAITRRRSTSNT
jgi:cyclopropane fatty-acyl-phospholipid synthase-like methyltransferase